jgi:hypothetical protein
MSKSSPLHRFDAAVQAFISSRRALGRAILLDEYVLHRLRAYLAGAGYSDLDAESFEGWRRQLHHCAHTTQVDLSILPVPPASREPVFSASARDPGAPSAVSVTHADRG